MPSSSHKIRLLFHVQTLLSGGIEKVLLELLQGLSPERYAITLLITHHLGAHEVLKAQLPEYVNVQYLLEPDYLNRAKRKKMTAKISIAEKLLSELILPGIQARIIRRRLAALTTEADVFIDFDMTLGAYHDSIRSARRVAYCHFSLANYWNGKRRKLDKLAKRLERNDRVIMLCDEMKAEAAAMYPFLEPKLARLYNALDMDRVRRMAEESLAEFSRFETEPFLLSVGRLQESQKDFTTLIRAYAKAVREAAIAEPLVIVGKGGYQEQLEALAAMEGVADRVVFAGFHPNPYKWMARCKLFLFSSKYEGLPTVLIEALSLGAAIIGTACPTGVREILMEGRAGVLTPVGEVDAMAAAIPGLVDDESRKAAFRAASEAILRQFDIRFMVGEFERIVVAGER